MSTESSPNPPQQHIVIDGISYIPSCVLLTGIPKLSIKDNRAFAVLDRLGQAPRIYSPGSELGFFFNDTRYLGVWEMTLNGEQPVPMASELRENGNSIVVSMTNRDLKRIDQDDGKLDQSSRRIPRDVLLMRRILSLVNDQLYETVEIKNFDSESHLLQLEVWSGSRFDDLFEVRGYLRAARGKMLPIEEIGRDTDRTTIHAYEGLDGITRKTFIRRFFEIDKILLSPGLAGYSTRIRVPSKETVSLRSVVGFNRSPDVDFIRESFFSSTPKLMRELENHQEKEPKSNLTFECDNTIITRAINSAQTDVHMLLTKEDDSTVYPYAGIPWFSAPFGRDGMITAYQMLPWAPWIAKGALTYAFQRLGSKVDAFTDEEPGKIFHEMRMGEMAQTREIPFIPYYGSVDSTPLALILLQEYVLWTRDMQSLKEWWPIALRALDWVEKWGDPRNLGFLEYARQSTKGLINQGWKDSHDSVMHADGTLAVAPIQLCEVQGYAFRCRRAMSELAHMMGDRELSEKLRLDALKLRARFSEYFWDGSRQIIALALDGAGKPCLVRSSNMGQCLWSEILSPEQALEVTRHLFSSAMFSGYGIRTLADTEVSYNPMSYHNGSIWPHDNSLIMEGLRKYGLTRELETLSTALMDVIEASDDFRLPELFCGFRRRGNAAPVPYEVACKPQAWAAGSIFLMIKSMLGLSTQFGQSHVVFNSPILAPKINRFEVKGLKGPDWEIDVLFRRNSGSVSVEVMKKSGNVRVMTVR